MPSELDEHVSEFHGNLKAGEGATLIEEHKTMLTDISTLKRNSAIVVELVAGKEIVDPFTGRETGERADGIAQRVKSLEHNANGGAGFSIRNKDKAQLIGFMTIVIVALERGSRYL